MCGKCGGLVPEPMKPYGYAGRYCGCAVPTPPKENMTTITTTVTNTKLEQTSFQQELKQQAQEEFYEKFIPPTIKNYAEQLVVEKIGIPMIPSELKDFIDSLIDRTVQMTEERLMGIITKRQEDGLNVQIEGDYYINFRDLESLITNKSDINK